MEIKDYIAETLVQITQGIKEAQNRLKDEDVIVNPGKTFGSQGDYWIGKQQEHGAVLRRIQEVEMKIGVVSSEEVTGDGGAKVRLGVLNLGAGVAVFPFLTTRWKQRGQARRNDARRKVVSEI